MIIELEKKYEDSYKRLVRLLWNDIEENELEEIIQEHYLGKSKIFIYVMINGDKAVGFVNTSIRNDYVEGCTNNNPDSHIHHISFYSKLFKFFE